MSAMIPQIRVLEPCADAVEWLTSQLDPETAWAVCERADWMLWLAVRLDIDRPTLVRAACDCARIALKYVPTGEDRPQLAIEAAERWADDPSKENHKAARGAVSAAVYAAAARAAAHAAAYAARAGGAAGLTALKAMTKLVRARIPWAMVAEKLEDRVMPHVLLVSLPGLRRRELWRDSDGIARWYWLTAPAPAPASTSKSKES